MYKFGEILLIGNNELMLYRIKNGRTIDTPAEYLITDIIYISFAIRAAISFVPTFFIPSDIISPVL